jgi:TonB family protein
VKYTLRLDFAGSAAAPAAKPAGSAAAPAALPVEAGATKEGPLSVEAVRDGIEARAADFRACYRKEQKKQKALAGKVVVRFTVRGDGSVKNVKVKESTLGNAAVEACLVGIAGTLHYPAADSGQETRVIFPFSFTP